MENKTYVIENEYIREFTLKDFDNLTEDMIIFGNVQFNHILFSTDFNYYKDLMEEYGFDIMKYI